MVVRAIEVRRGSRAAGVTLLAAAALLWSTGGVGIKSVDLPPMAIAGWRAAFALPVLAGMLVVRARSCGSEAARLAVRQPFVWLAAASYAVMVIAFVVATKLTTAANAIFIQYTSPVYVAALSWPLLRERVTWREGVACGGVIAGMLLFFGDALSGTAKLGNAVAVVSSFGAAGMPLAMRADQRALVRRGAIAAADVSPAIAIAIGDAAGIALCLPAMMASPPHDTAAWSLLAALGIAQIGVPYVLYAVAVPKLTALESSLVPTIEPILNPVWVLMATGERPSALAVAGGAFVLASVSALAFTRAR